MNQEIKAVVNDTIKRMLHDDEYDSPIEFNIFVSFIMEYGFDQQDIYTFAQSEHIAVDPDECDLDDPDDHYGSLVITEEYIKKEELL